MRPDDLLEFLRRRPFEPFRLNLSDGTTYDVRHPEMMMVGRSRALIGIAAAEQPFVFDKVDSVALLHITRLEPLPPQAEPISN